MDTTAWKPESFDIFELAARGIPHWLYGHLDNPEQIVQRVCPRIVGRGFRRADVEASLRGAGDVALKDRISILVLAAHDENMSVTEILQKYLKETSRVLTDGDRIRLQRIGEALQREGEHLSKTLAH
ncbi:MAG: hypothetical protein Q8R32_02660 [bacterium]|nr:hypothetical protein [bacterium]